ncbi:hypothetical protein D3C80_2060710 [compost metagenome]
MGIQHVRNFSITFGSIWPGHVFTLGFAAAAYGLEGHILHPRQQICMHFGEPAGSDDSDIECHFFSSCDGYKVG